MSAVTRQYPVAMALVATAAALWLLHWLRDVITPLVVSLVLVVLVQALIRAIDRRLRWMPAWLVVSAAAFVIILALGIALTVLVQGLSQMVVQAPALYARIGDVLLQISAALDLEQPLQLSTLLGDVSLP